jgi:hypothetical protein
MCDTPFDRSFFSLKSMYDYRQKARITSKTLVAQNGSQSFVYAKGLSCNYERNVSVNVPNWTTAGLTQLLPARTVKSKLTLSVRTEYIYSSASRATQPDGIRSQ